MLEIMSLNKDRTQCQLLGLLLWCRRAEMHTTPITKAKPTEFMTTTSTSEVMTSTITLPDVITLRTLLDRDLEMEIQLFILIHQ